MAHLDSDRGGGVGFCAFENTIWLCCEESAPVEQYSIPDLKLLRSIDADMFQCLATDGKRMVAQVWDSQIALLDLATEKEVWRLPTSGSVWNSRADFATDVVYVPRKNGLLLLRLSTGEQLAKQSGVYEAETYLDSNHGLVYVSSPSSVGFPHRLECLDSRTLERRGTISLLQLDAGLFPLEYTSVSRYLLALPVMGKILAVIEQKKGCAPTAAPKTVEYGNEGYLSMFVEGGASPLRVLIAHGTAVLELDFAHNLDDA